MLFQPLLDPIDFNSWNILQNIFFCSEKKEGYTGLEWHESE